MPDAARSPATRLSVLGRRLVRLALAALLVATVACDRAAEREPGGVSDAGSDAVTDSLADAASPPFHNASDTVAYVGDAACVGCHAAESRAWSRRSMARSFDRWDRATRVESTLVAPLVHPRTGLRYAVVEDRGRLWQVEFLEGPGGRRLHELRRRMDWFAGSGRVGRTYFVEENGRLFQLPLTWYATHGWDFSPGYEVTNLRFDRLLPDRCVGCHSSYPRTIPHVEGKYAELRPGIGCERCHGPGALHVAARRTARDSVPGYDATIVNPARLPLERRLDVCEQCHVHAAVELPREGRGAFSFVPSQRLSDHWAFFRTGGGDIDVVSHADRLRQSACFLATRRSSAPLECATCHDPHAPGDSSAATPATPATRNAPCAGCHTTAALAATLGRSSAKAEHAAGADCVRCHMPAIKERAVPHGTFTEHWIRIPGRDGDGSRATRARPRDVAGYVEAYYARDRRGPEAALYRGMGAVVHATLANDRRALAPAAESLAVALGDDGARGDAGGAARGDAQFLLGVAWQQLGDAARATAALERAAAAEPGNPEALRALAQAHLAAGRVDVGDSLYRRAIAAQPALAWIRAEYAGLLLARGDRARAVAAYRAALAEQPSLAVAWFDLGTALLGGDDAAGATRAFREAVTLDPSLGEALSLLVRVRTRGDVVTEVAGLDAPLPAVPVRDRGPRGVRLGVVAGAVPAVTFANLPAFGIVQVLRPDGTQVRSLSDGGQRAVTWDLRGNDGRVVGGGLHRVRVLGRDGAGRALPPQLLSIGVVR